MSPEKKQRTSSSGSCEAHGGATEIEELDSALIQWSVMVRLDARSLARCRLVCRAWSSMASADWLWLPHCCKFLFSRALLPLKFTIQQQESLSPLSAFNAFIVDALKTKLSSADFCGRTWELGVKPICGTYWYFLDPTTRGEPALVRYFNCDGSLTAGPRDPIWGGQESCWKFVSDESCTDQYVKINYWPLFTILQLGDGRWRLENKWATYTMQPDLYLGTGSSIFKEVAPSCTGCDYSRLQNAVMPVTRMTTAGPRHSVLKRMLASSATLPRAGISVSQP